MLVRSNQCLRSKRLNRCTIVNKHWNFSYERREGTSKYLCTFRDILDLVSYTYKDRLSLFRDRRVTSRAYIRSQEKRHLNKKKNVKNEKELLKC